MAYQAFKYPIFQPAMRIITSITNAVVPTITTSFPHQYLTGLIVRLYIPEGFGIVQANQLQGEIVVTSPTTFTINIDTSMFDIFSTPSSFPFNQQQAQVVPVGEDALTIASSTRNVLPYVIE